MIGDKSKATIYNAKKKVKKVEKEFWVFFQKRLNGKKMNFTGQKPH